MPDLDKLKTHIENFAPQEGLNLTPLDGFGCFKSLQTISRTAAVNVPVLLVLAQGRKVCFLEDQKHIVQAGQIHIRFFPVVIDMEVNEASPQAPLLAAGLGLDLNRMAEMLSRVERIKDYTVPQIEIEPSSIVSIPLTDAILTPLLRLFEILNSPADIAMLADGIIDEIYYRLVSNELNGSVRSLLSKRSSLLRISNAINHIHTNIGHPVSIGELADLVNMSKTTFHENFKAVMHMSPLQYVKSVKLFEAKKLIEEGKKANEACYMVGYNSAAQFSREFKRQFGVSPSEVRQCV